MGRNQADFMKTMLEFGGWDGRWNSWIWGNRSKTLKMLKGLEKRGYVECKGRDGWRVTEDGQRAIYRVEAEVDAVICRR
jgi:ribosomal protein S19E (S16A)